MARIKSNMSKQTICKTKTHNYEKRCQEPKWVADIFFYLGYDQIRPVEFAPGFLP